MPKLAVRGDGGFSHWGDGEEKLPSAMYFTVDRNLLNLLLSVIYQGQNSSYTFFNTDGGTRSTASFSDSCR